MGRKKTAPCLAASGAVERNLDIETITKKTISVNSCAVRAVHLAYFAHCHGIQDAKIATMLNTCFGLVGGNK
jgi:hypothetical protein